MVTFYYVTVNGREYNRKGYRSWEKAVRTCDYLEICFPEKTVAIESLSVPEDD